MIITIYFCTTSSYSFGISSNNLKSNLFLFLSDGLNHLSH
nr:MAG TPA_asm: hypothetical protein [Caudoviricetes sp.]DAX07237.1 MAG TPA: hypothetical protein [Bacteriophage sp.]